MILLFVPIVSDVLLQVSQESFLLELFAKQGLPILMLAIIIWWLIKDFGKREAEYKADKIRLETEYKALLAKRDEEIKALYEVQSKEYKVQLEMLARNADIMKQVRVLVESGTIRNTDIDLVKTRQIDTHNLLTEILKELKNPPL